MRLRCKAFGCVYDDHNSCARCGEDLYSGEFVQIGWLDPIYTLIHKWEHSRWKRHHTCETCKCQMWFTDEYCCSETCYQDWIPF